MATQADLRRLALALPGTSEAEDDFAFAVEHRGKARGFVWSWKERVDPKKPRVRRDDVVAIRVADGDDKAALLAGDPAVCFTEPHYRGFPAVLVRLELIDTAELGALVVEAWRTVAPRPLVERFEADRPSA